MSATTTINITDHSRQKPLSAEHPISIEDTTVSFDVYDKLGSHTRLAKVINARVLHEGHHDASTNKTYPDAYYVDPKDVDFSKLKKSSTITYCPYKGYAAYYSTEDQADVAWVYDDAYDQVRDIKGFLSFYTDRTEKK